MKTVFHSLVIAVLLLGTVRQLPAQEFWYEYFQKSQSAALRADWQETIAHLRNALKVKKEPELDAETFANIKVDYLPYYWLGVAYFNAGAFRQARAAFDSSLMFRAVRMSGMHEKLLHYRDLSTAYLNAGALRDSLQTVTQALQRLQADSSRYGREIRAVATALAAGDEPAARARLGALQRDFPDRAEVSLFRHLLSQVPQKPVVTNADSLRSLFEMALQRYLAGDYAGALITFRAVAARNPTYRQVDSWIRRAQTEATLLPQPARRSPETIYRIDTTSSAPFVVFTTPARTRSRTVRLTGRVGDDLGVDFLEITVNGAALRTAEGPAQQLRPAAEDDPKNFGFAVDIPLQQGTNRVVVTARDRDPQVHSAAYPIVITRLPPLYKTPAVLLTAAAIALFALGGWVSQRLIRQEIALKSKYNPYIAGAPVVNEKMFFGREPLLQRILHTIHNNSILICGPRRIGKTSLQHQLHKRLENLDDPAFAFFPVYIDLQGVHERSFFASMMQDIVEALAADLPGRESLRIRRGRAGYTARDFSTDLRQVLDMLQHRTGKTPKLVLQLDEVDVLNNFSEQVNQKLRSIFMKSYAENLVAVMSGTSIRRRWESEGSPWYNFFEQIQIAGIDSTAARRLIETPVRGIYRYDAAAVERILEVSEMIPYRIQKLCVHLINFAIARRKRRLSRADVDRINAELRADTT